MEKYTWIVGCLLLAAAPAKSQQFELADSEEWIEPQVAFEFGQNYSWLGREGYSELGSYWDYGMDLSWTGFDDEAEPIDEIVVVGRRRVGGSLHLFGEFRFGAPYTRICGGYSDGGYCIGSRIKMADAKTFPLDPPCQQVAGTMGPLSVEQAEKLNLEHRQEKHFWSGVSYTGAAIGATLATRGGVVLAAILADGALGVSQIVSGWPQAGDTPYREGQTVTYTVSACNNENLGGIDMTVDVDIE